MTQSETLTAYTLPRYSHKHLPDIHVRDTVKNVDTLSHPRYRQRHLPDIHIDTVKNVDTVSHPRYSQRHLPAIHIQGMLRNTYQTFYQIYTSEIQSRM